MRVQTITAAEFVDGKWGLMSGRFQCLKCGSECYTGDVIFNMFGISTAHYADWTLDYTLRFTSCSGRYVAPCYDTGCTGEVVNVTDNMAEVAALFAACGYSVKSAADNVEQIYRDSLDRLLIRVGFTHRYDVAAFYGIPPSYYYNIEGGFSLVFAYDNFQILTPWEQELVREDAIQSLYDWIKGIYDSEVYKVWRLAELL